MTAAHERRYRRLLRLLPAGYRQAWEEDMVSAFLQSTERNPSLGERLSVVVLAIRLRLTRSHSFHRDPAWSETIRIFALLIMLYQALAATAGVTWNASTILSSPVVYPTGILSHLVAWGRPAVMLLWIAAFIALATGRLVVTRVLVLIAAAGAVGLSLGLSVVSPRLAAPPSDTAATWGWFVASVLAVLLIPADRTREGIGTRPRWLGAYLVGALVLVLVEFYRSLPAESSLVRQYLDLPTIAHLGLLAGMVLALGQAAWRVSKPHWLLALGALGAGDASTHLIDPYGSAGILPIVGFHAPQPVGTRLEIDVVLGLLGVICAATALVALRRPPRTVPGPA